MFAFRSFFLFVVWQSLFIGCSAPKSESLEPLIAGIKERFAPDQRVALFKIDVNNQDGSLVLKGETTLPDAKQALFDSLSIRKIAVVDSIRVLPDTTIGGKPWGLVTLSVGNIRVAPDHAAEMATQLLLGTPVKILQRVEGWYRVQSPDKYIGWCDERVLAPLTQADLAVWKQSDRYIYRRNNGFAFSEAESRSSVVSDLVLGDLFAVSGEEKGFLRMQFPDGRTGFVQKNECQLYSEWIVEEPKVDQAIETAKMLTGSPYLWGGTSTKGVDCSGLIKTAYFSEGVILARDASQQARYGEILSVTDSLNFQPGDLLFFGKSKERISHVAMYIGNGKYIHSSGLVRINSLNAHDPDYSESHRKRLVSAGRIIHSLNTEEIIQVKAHPWYN
ncbi:MAG: NlpC/P60 family protein [Mangrovibacterium sp.]